MMMKEGLVATGSSSDIPPPPAVESGRRIVSSMRSWLRGHGPLGRLIAPIRDDGTLYPLGIRTRSPFLEVFWYSGDDHLAEVVELSESDLRAGRGWNEMLLAQPAPQAAWAWRWTFDELVRSLGKVLASKEP